jgi:ABC-type phosphate transport system substrate-binding protein
MVIVMKKLVYIIFFVLLSVMTANAQSFKVIVNNSNAVTSLTATQASQIFLKKTTKWDNGSKILPIDLSSQLEVRTDFTETIHGKSVNAIKSYWQQYVFSGKGTPPLEKKSDAEVLEFIKNNAGAIGYVSSDFAVPGVKVISIK